MLCNLVFYLQIYSNNEALTPNPKSPLEDYSIHLVDIKYGRLCDTRHFKIDKIYLSQNQGESFGITHIKRNVTLTIIIQQVSTCTKIF